MNTLLIISLTTLIAIALVHALRKPLLVFFTRLRAKLHVHSLRRAINDADADKQRTGRKNIVVFNSSTGSYEPAQKRMLKFLSERNKKKPDAVRVKVRKKNGVVVKVVQKKKNNPVGSITHERVKTAEKKSLYVTT